MGYTAGVVLACLAMAVLIGMVYQAVSYARGRQLISRRQFAMRMATGALLLLTVAMVFYWPVSDLGGPWVKMIYLGVLMLLPVAVFVLAWLDLRLLARAQHQRQAELYRNLAEIEDSVRAARGKQDGP